MTCTADRLIALFCETTGFHFDPEAPSNVQKRSALVQAVGAILAEDRARPGITGRHPRVLTYEVEGEGPFPFDMLRYDRSWPAREGEDAYQGLGDRDETYSTRRRVRLCTVSAGVSTARWRSFGWTVVVPPQADPLHPAG